MKKDLDLLIVSGLENRRTLSRIFSGLPVNVFHAATIGQARELLSRQEVGVVFCEERLPDGTLGDLLKAQFAKPRMTRWVVLLATGESGRYLDALRLGAADAIRCPLQPTDVEMALIRATRNQQVTGTALGLTA
jgi:DNA-binding NtrC family response regulator